MTDKPSIVWLTLESTRFDHTSLTGYDRDTTPELAAIANRPDATSFDRCFSHGIWTRPSSTSILTGTYPSSHNVLDSGDTIPDELPTLPELLSEAGYTTIGFGTNGQLDSLCEEIEAFDEYVPNTIRRNLHKCAGVIGLAKFLPQLRRHSGGFTADITQLNVGYLINEGIRRRVDRNAEPTFLYAHYKDPHFPYVPPLPYLREYTADLDVSASEAVDLLLDVQENEFEYAAAGHSFSETEWSAITALYDACIAYTDERIGAIVSHLKSALDDPVIVITADHGELLGERDLIGHHLVTHDALCHVPLVVTGPTELLDYEGHVQHVDVVRTLLEEAGAETGTIQGVDLREDRRDWSVVQRGGARAEKRIDTVLEHDPDPDLDVEQFHEGPLTALRDDDFKYERSAGTERLYRLPDESTDVTASRPDVADRFRAELDSFEREIRSYDPREKELSDRTKKQLREMGYLVD